MKKLFLNSFLISIFLVLCFAAKLSAQHTLYGKVIDNKSKKPLAFVNILANNNAGTTTDIDGIFRFNTPTPITSLKLSYVGYEAQEVDVQDLEKITIELISKSYQLQEVIVRAGENPAHRIIKKVVDNRNIHNPEKSLDFKYDSYSKLYVTGNPDSAIVNNKERFEKLDSNDKEMLNWLENHYIMMMESVTERSYKQPNKNFEKVIASRVSGLQNPTFALLGTQLQSFSFYNPYMNVLDKAYLNPISTNSINKYLFVIEDTTFSGKDTVFIISFTPLKNKNFEALKGLLYINTNGYALQNVIAEPYKQDEGVAIKIQQQYELLEGKWFPKQLSSTINFNSLEANGFKLIGLSRTYIKNVELNPELKNKQFGYVDTEIDPNATRKDEVFWNKYREDTLSQKEKNTYHVIDSLGKAENLDKKLAGLEAFFTGKITWGKIDLDLNRFVSYNNYEGFRLGGGFHTNKRLLKWVSVGGYGAYSFKDKEEKYGGDITFFIQPQNDVELNFSYTKDVEEPGVVNFSDYKIPFISAGGIRVLYLDKMNNIEKYEARLKFRTLRYLKTYLFVNQQDINVTDSSYFVKPIDDFTFLRDRNYQFTEIGAEFRYAYKEKVLKTLSQSYNLTTDYPIIYAKIEQGISTLDGEYEYTRLTLRTEKKFMIKNLGQPYFRVETGYTLGEVPLHKLNHAIGTYRAKGMMVATENAFETILPYEFLANKYVYFHFRHSFKGLLLKIKKFQPEFVLTSSVGYGDLDHKELHQGIAFKTMNKGFYESGLVINSILKLNNSTFGIGAFYRYGPYQFDKPSDNFAFKLSLGFAL